MRSQNSARLFRSPVVYAASYITVLTAFLASPSMAQTGPKIFVDADGEGMAGIFHVTTQLMPITAPRWQESRKLMTRAVNEAIAGLFDGGAASVHAADHP